MPETRSSVERGGSADALLGGRVTLSQPVGGYRAAIDPVLLAAAVAARDEDRILDVGAGSGAAMLCLACRVPNCRIVGLELQTELAELADRNIGANGVTDRVQVVRGDLLRPPPQLVAGSFDRVMANPPYGVAGDGTPPPDAGLTRAHVEGEAGLADWIAFCLAMLRPKGHLVMIHRAERLGDILAGLRGRAGEAVVFPLWPRAGEPAKRVIVRARKGARTPLRISSGLVLHDPDGSYTRAADAVLRDGAALML